MALHENASGELIEAADVLVDCPACPCNDPPCVDFEFSALWTNGPYNTGVDDDHVRLGNTATCEDELHWTVDAATAKVPSTTDAGIWNPLVIGNDAQYISINCEMGTTDEPDPVDYDYETTFDIPATVDPATLVIYGTWTADDEGLDILINGTSTGQTCGHPIYGASLFVLQDYFVSGSNTLTFRVRNSTAVQSGVQFTCLGVTFACYNADLL